MIERIRTLIGLPGQLLLGWRLFRDPRVPTLPKVILVGAIVLILSPLDVLDWIPVIGGAGSIALLAVVVRTFINAAPDDVRAHHMAALGMNE
jgi:uncharacterized membrane protein YkvA (DUF1232 family)